MKIYTKGGDKGTTSLVGGQRVAKDDLRVEAYGTADELMANIGHLHDKLIPFKDQYPTRETLRRILTTLMDVAEILATQENSPYPTKQITQTQISFLEEQIDQINQTLKPITDFTLPCGHEILSFCHICRTITRRCERTVISASGLYHIDNLLIIYLNRLSDYLYILGRKLTVDFNIKETYRMSEK